MDIHAKKNLAMSGQRNGKTHHSRPHIRLWNTKTLETLATLGFGEYELRVATVAFSTNENGETLLAGVNGGGDDYVLSVWQWDDKAEKAPLVGKVATRAEGIKGVTFHPLDNHLVSRFFSTYIWFFNSDSSFLYELVCNMYCYTNPY